MIPLLLLPSTKVIAFPLRSFVIASGCTTASRFRYRDIEEIMAERGVKLTYETVRKWCLKFGQRYDNALHRCRPQAGDKWYLDEVFLAIHGQVHYAWRAVDQHGTVLKVLVQRRRDKKAAQKFFRKLLQGLGVTSRGRSSPTS